MRESVIHLCFDLGQVAQQVSARRAEPAIAIQVRSTVPTFPMRAAARRAALLRGR